MKFLRVMSMTVALSTILMTNAFAATKGVTSGSNINVRSAASTDSSIVKVLELGTSFEFVGIENNFLKTTVDGVEGYISADFVRLETVDGTINADSVNVRTSPSVTGSVAGSLNSGSQVTAIGKTGEWIVINHNGSKNYIHRDFFTSQYTEFLTEVVNVETAVAVSTYAIVEASGGLKLRSSSSVDASVITVLPNGEIVDVIGVAGDWVNVSANGTSGYVSKEFVDVRTGEKPSRSVSSNKGEQIVSYAKQFMGTPYVWGGTNLSGGVDCSGYTYSVYRNFGINLNRVASDQSRNGVRISRSELVAGDLIFFDTSGSNNGEITHVGIYMGNGQFIHASSGGGRVMVSDLNSGYYNNRVVTASRVVR